MRAQERQLVWARLGILAVAAVFLLIVGRQVPGLPVLLGVIGVVAAYTLTIPLLLRRFPPREVGIVSTGVDMAAVTVAVYAAPNALDIYLFYALVILSVALRFGLGAAIWASIVMSAMYVTVILAGSAPFILRPNITLPSTTSQGKSEGSWKTMRRSRPGPVTG